jgi:hypothetical protein
MPYCPNCRSEYEPEIDRCPDCNVLLVDSLPPEDAKADPNGRLVDVFVAAGDEEAIIVKGLLESEGIECSLSSDIPHTVMPLNVDGLGAVRITVAQEDAERARQIIREHEEQTAES